MLGRVKNISYFSCWYMNMLEFRCQCRPYVPMETVILICQALTQSFFNHYDRCLGTYQKGLTDRLQKWQSSGQHRYIMFSYYCRVYTRHIYLRKLTFLLYCVTFGYCKMHLPQVNVSRVNMAYKSADIEGLKSLDNLLAKNINTKLLNVCAST